MYFPHYENPARPLGSTIVDAELVIDTDPKTKQVRSLCAHTQGGVLIRHQNYAEHSTAALFRLHRGGWPECHGQESRETIWGEPSLPNAACRRSTGVSPLCCTAAARALL